MMVLFGIHYGKIIIKMKKIVLSIIIQFMILSLAYNQSIDLEVQASSGNSFKDQYVSVDWTLGEPVTEYISDNKNSLYNGFQQAFDIIENCSGYCYTLSGITHTGDTYLQNGTVLIIDKSNFNVIDSFVVENGNFRLEQIPPGLYIFLAKPYGAAAGQFNPTYWVNKLTPEKADTITVDKYDIGSIDIYLVRIGTSVDTLSGNVFKVQVYPNPAYDLLYIEGLQNPDASIFDLSGRILFQSLKTNGRIDISGLKAGIYILHLKRDGRTFFQKVIKQ